MLKEYEELITLGKTYTPNDNRVLRRLRLLQFEWHEELALDLKKYLLNKKSQRELNKNPFIEPLKEETEGNILVGHVNGDEEMPFSLNEERLKLHIFIVGESRVGKTTLIYHLLRQIL